MCNGNRAETARRVGNCIHAVEGASPAPPFKKVEHALDEVVDE